MNKKDEINRLIEEQKADRNWSILKPQITTPTKVKPFQDIEDMNLRAIYILKKFCAYSYRDLAKLSSLKWSWSTVRRRYEETVNERDYEPSEKI